MCHFGLENNNKKTSQANILHLDQKAAKCMTGKWLYEKV